jgi:hypothetical protein
MAEYSIGMVVTERMLTEAARAGDFERLTSWARQGVRVTTVEPLCVAAEEGHLEVVRCLVQQMGADVSHSHYGDTPLIVAAENGYTDLVRLLVTDLGADVNQAIAYGWTPLMLASRGNLCDGVVRCLVELGAEVGAVDPDGNTALLESARNARYTTMQYLVEEGGANMDDVNNNGETVWDLLLVHLEALQQQYDEEETDPDRLTGLLRVLVLRGGPPPALVALLSPEPARVVQEGARLRARLPAYLVRRRALLDAHCPMLLSPLRALVHGYFELTTTEELWATGLGQAP